MTHTSWAARSRAARATRGGTALVTSEGAEPDRHGYGAAPQLLGLGFGVDVNDARLRLPGWGW